MSRSLKQSYTHTVTLIKDFGSEKKGREFKLFDDGVVFDAEIMTFRKPDKEVAALIQSWEAFPSYCEAVENPDYHNHSFKEKTIRVCDCGEKDDE